MAGRRITVNTRKARRDRERQRRNYAEKKREPIPFDARSLAQVLTHWSRT